MPKKIYDWVHLSSIIEQLTKMNYIKTSHASALLMIGCYGFISDCTLEIEKSMRQGKLIFRSEGKRFFTIRSKADGIWAEFFNPNDDLFPESTFKFLNLTYQKEGQYNKYGMNKFNAICPTSEVVKEIFQLMDISKKALSLCPIWKKRENMQ
jgi:hypothetical protein